MSNVRTYETPVQKVNVVKLFALAALVIFASAAYLLIDSKMYNPKLFAFVMSLRIPTLIVMLIAAFAIGAASIIFQSIINNRIVTPCLLGMNSMYLLVPTAVVFFACSSSIVAVNTNVAYVVDLIVMGITATIIYWYLFQKTIHNVLIFIFL